jgi:hypothetical protein
MAAYQLLAGGVVLRASDGAAIPPDPGNGDWREYQAWVAAGNQPDAEAPRPAIRKRLTVVLESLPTARKKALLQAAGADPALIDD